MANLYFKRTTPLREWAQAANWWLDDAFTIPAGRVPTSSDDVYVNAPQTPIFSSDYAGGVYFNNGFFTNVQLGTSAQTARQFWMHASGDTHFYGTTSLQYANISTSGDVYFHDTSSFSPKTNNFILSPIAGKTIFFLDNSRCYSYYGSSVEGSVVCSGTAGIDLQIAGSTFAGDILLSDSSFLYVKRNYVYSNVTLNDSSTCTVFQEPSYTPTYGIYGNITFYGPSNSGTLPVSDGTSWNNVITFANSTENNGTVIGDVVFLNSSTNNGVVKSIGRSATIFRTTSHNAGTIDNGTFYDDSYNSSSVLHNASLYDNAYNTGTISGNATVYYPAPKPIGGTVSGTITYVGYPLPAQDLYFNGAVSTNAATLGNWWFDSEFTNPSTILPRSIDTIHVSANITGTFPSSVAEAHFDSCTDSTSVVVVGWCYYSYSIKSGNGSAGTYSFVYSTNNGSITGTSGFGYGAINNGSVSGDTSFFDAINNGSVSGNCTFYWDQGILEGYNSGTITGNVSFSGRAYNSVDGTITGNASFTESSYNSGAITGDASFTFPADRCSVGTIGGTKTYTGYPSAMYWHGGSWWKDSSFTTAGFYPDCLTPAKIYSNWDGLGYFYSMDVYDSVISSSGGNTVDVITGNASFNGTSVLTGMLIGDDNGTISFNDNSYVSSTGIVTQNYSGSVEFHDDSYNAGSVSAPTIKVYFPSTNPIGGTVNGNVLYFGYNIYFSGTDGNWSNVNNWWSDDLFTIPAGSLPTIRKSAQIYSDVNQSDGNALCSTMAIYSVNVSTYIGSYQTDVYGTGSISDTSGNMFASLHESSQNTGTLDHATFEDNSENNGTITGSCVFSDDSINNGTCNGGILVVFNYPAADYGTANNARYIGYPTTGYFNGAVNADWSNRGNWWYDSGFTEAILVPFNWVTAYISASVSSNTAPRPTSLTNAYISGGTLGINISVSASANFSDSAVCDGTITGNCNFTDSSYLTGSVTGNASFSDDSYNDGEVSGNGTFSDQSENNNTISGNGTFSNTSVNNGSVGGNATLNNTTSNLGSITGNATFNNTSFNDGVVSGTATFNASSYNLLTIGYGVFNGNSYNRGTVSNNASFFNSSVNRADGTVNGNAILKNSASNLGTINGNADVYYPSDRPINGIVLGTVTYYGYRPDIVYISSQLKNPYTTSINSALENPYKVAIESTIFV